jgi:hypothetical protein
MDGFGGWWGVVEREANVAGEVLASQERAVGSESGGTRMILLESHPPDGALRLAL